MQVLIELLKKLFGYADSDSELRIGTRVGFSSVIEIGTTPYETGSVVPVKLSSGDYAILSVNPSSLSKSGKTITQWKSDNCDAGIAISQSIKMPSVHLTPSNNSVIIRGEDSRGKFGVVLYCNYRKIECGWIDEFQRLEAKKVLQ